MRWLIERQLRQTQRELTKARAHLEVLREQRLTFDDDAADAELRAIVNEGPEARREHRDQARHAQAMAGAERDLIAKVARLDARRDELLDKMSRSANGGES